MNRKKACAGRAYDVCMASSRLHEWLMCSSGQHFCSICIYYNNNNNVPWDCCCSKNRAASKRISKLIAVVFVVSEKSAVGHENNITFRCICCCNDKSKRKHYKHKLSDDKIRIDAVMLALGFIDAHSRQSKQQQTISLRVGCEND